jgi:ribonuclease HII
VTWVIGIDEAGYGPNLGPLVVSCVGFRVPDHLADAELWSLLSSGVRRHPSDDDGRVLVDDSKLVYSTAKGIEALELNVMAAMQSAFPEQRSTLARLLKNLACLGGELPANPWYTGRKRIPVVAEGSRCAELAEKFQQSCQASEVHCVHISSVVVDSRNFNRLTDESNKSGVLAHALMAHVRHASAVNRDEPLHFYIDKHGGRNSYAAMLQDALTEGMVIVERESANESTYNVLGGNRQVRFTIRPRADGDFFCVALASMLSKYVRELLMLEFNAFWKKHIPDIAPTAGYPGDSDRFYRQIQPVMLKLGIAEEDIWRRR